MGNTESPVRKPPKFLCKYRGLANCQEWERALRIITENKIYHPNPTTFNDPFDCKVGSLGSVEPRFVRYLLAARAATPDKHHDVYREFCDARRKTPDELSQLNAPLDAKETSGVKGMLANIQERVDASTVLCLCERRDSILMWSHLPTTTGVSA